MKKNIAKLKKKLWTLVSKYVRAIHSKDGYCICYTCGVRKPIKEMQAGHGFSGRGNSILFELDIIRPQCYGCNCCNSGKLDIFTYKLRKELGDERFDELFLKKNKIRQFTTYELEDEIIRYNKLLKDILTQC